MTPELREMICELRKDSLIGPYLGIVSGWNDGHVEMYGFSRRWFTLDQLKAEYEHRVGSRTVARGDIAATTDTRSFERPF